MPRSASSFAAHMPAGPAPIIMTSQSVFGFDPVRFMLCHYLIDLVESDRALDLKREPSSRAHTRS